MKSKRIIILSLLFIFIILFIRIIIVYFPEEKNIKIINSTNNHIKENLVTIESSEKHEENIVYNSPIDELQETYNNTDILAELKIESINLDTVITKSTDNEYYLKHNAYRQRSDFGNPYIDYRNSNDLTSERQINIYSHNFYNKEYSDYLPFSKLEKYLNKDVFDIAKDIYLYTDTKLMHYEVYAIKIITKENNEHMIMDASSNAKWQTHLDNLLKDTKYCTDDCHLDNNTNLLVLQTCNYNPNGSFMLVIARKVI